MNRLFVNRLVMAGLAVLMLGMVVAIMPSRHAVAQGVDTTNTTTCPKPTFLGLKPWYYYLPLSSNNDGTNKQCRVDLSLSNGDSPDISNINKLWLIGIVLFEDLLRVAALLAVGFVIFGGVQYITSQGEPDRTKTALSTIINALIGLAIAVSAATLMAFLGKRLGA